MDKLKPHERSENMRRIRSKGMKPELEVRKLVHGLGYRYRLHVETLPGKPDLVFTSRRKIIQVHGCFWHQHTACIDGHFPKSRTDYWEPKLSRNLKRDHENEDRLRLLGWKTMTIWE